MTRKRGDAARTFTQLPVLSTPRPNGSEALDRTVEAVHSWLLERGVAVNEHWFTLRPYSMELLGLWMAGVTLLLPVAALLRWGWVGLVLALLLILPPVLETRFLMPTISALIRRKARNLEARFPAADAVNEVVLCAHLDSKTELLDHTQREVLFRLGTPAIVFAVLSGTLMIVEDVVAPGFLSEVAHWLALGLGLVVAIYCLVMGANLIGGRLVREQSSGAVDNGAAVAVLLDLASRLQRDTLRLRKTSVTLLFTVGEEAQMQGALAYVRDRDWPLPTTVINLEIIGQNAGFVLWRQDGTALVTLDTAPKLISLLAILTSTVTGQPIAYAEKISSDAFAFLRAGHLATTLGSLDGKLGDRGLHSAQDSPSRVDPDQLRQTTRALVRVLKYLDSISRSST